MKVAGIIAEYNPFHNGHAYHIEEVRKKTGADYVIVIMSGNFVQRGAPAIVDKYTRTKMALLGGADLVIELPVVAATASAETFARTGIAILNATGVVTHLGFGCESDDLKLLDSLATLFANEPIEYQEFLSSYLKEGLTFPAARAKAASEYLCVQQKSETHETISNVLNNPNNILAIEYLKAIKQLDSNIIPCPILRQGNHYHDQSLTPTVPAKLCQQKMASATAIRKEIYSSSVDECFIKDYLPRVCVDTLLDALKTSQPISENDFSQLLHYKLCLEQNKFKDYADVKEDLSNRIMSQMEYCSSFSKFIEELKTRNVTYTSVSRALLHVLLDIKEHDMDNLTKSNYAPYIRILGFKKNASDLLNAMKNASCPLILKLAQDKKNLTDIASHLLDIDINSTHIYNSIRSCNVEKNEYRTPLIYI